MSRDDLNTQKSTIAEARTADAVGKSLMPRAKRRPLKIKVTINVLIPEKAPQAGELEIEQGQTLGDALLKLSEGADLNSIAVRKNKDEIVAIDEMWEVRVNGRACYSFPDDLRVPLSRGDKITLWLTPLGGG